jgi:site-specific recombinase XerD
MSQSSKKHTPIAELIARYDDHLLSVRGLARSTRSLHRHVVQKFLQHRFPSGQIKWDDLHFSECVTFLKKEFTLLHNRGTQRAWLMVLRSILRYLAAEGHIPRGWDAALPRIPVYRQASLPRSLSEQQLADLERACRGDKPRHLRYRALLLLFHRLGLRAGEAANLHLEDVDWRSGCLRIRSTKNHHERLLPLPDDVGTALAAHLRASRPHSRWVFEPKRPPFSTERVYWHVHNSMAYLFGLAGIAHYGIHALRHYSASGTITR